MLSPVHKSSPVPSSYCRWWHPSARQEVQYNWGLFQNWSVFTQCTDLDILSHEFAPSPPRPPSPTSPLFHGQHDFAWTTTYPQVFQPPNQQSEVLSHTSNLILICDASGRESTLCAAFLHCWDHRLLLLQAPVV